MSCTTTIIATVQKQSPTKNRQVVIPPQPAKKTLLPVFVYGTLRTGQGNWRRLLQGRTSQEVSATLSGAKMYSRGIAYVTDATLEDAPEAQVVGDLMFIDPKKQDYAQIMRELDQLEGYDPTTNSGLYCRVAREVEYRDPATGNTRRVVAWVYYAGKDILRSLLDRDLVPDGDWLANHPNHSTTRRLLSKQVSQ